MRCTPTCQPLCRMLSCNDGRRSLCAPRSHTRPGYPLLHPRSPANSISFKSPRSLRSEYPLFYRHSPANSTSLHPFHSPHHVQLSTAPCKYLLSVHFHIPSHRTSASLLFCNDNLPTSLRLLVCVSVMFIGTEGMFFSYSKR